MLKLIYIAVLIILSGAVIAQEVNAAKAPKEVAHDEAVKRNRKTAKKLKAQHKREHNRKRLKRDKRDVLKPRFKPRPKYQPGRVSRPVVE